MAGNANEEGPDQGAPFRIEGPDEDGCVWVCSAAGRDVWCHNLGPKVGATEEMTRWLAEIDFGEKPDL